jgi:hypothetical protein
MAVLTPITPDRTTGALYAPVAAAGGGDSFPNTGREFLHVLNGGGSSITVTVAIAVTVEGQAVPGKAFTVGNGAQRIMGPFPTGTFNDSNSRVNITYSGVTSVTVGVIQATGVA